MNEVVHVGFIFVRLVVCFVLVQFLIYLFNFERCQVEKFDRYINIPSVNYISRQPCPKCQN